MGRVPCCEKDNVKRGQWTPEEDNKLSSYIAQHGTRNWRLIPKNAGLQRCGKSCRLRWTNYLRPDLKHGEFSESEEQTIVKLHSVFGNRWSLIAGQLPGRTDNDVKNYWNTKLKKKLSGMGIDPVTHKPILHLVAEIATALPPSQVPHLAEAALGCFKDEVLHLLSRKRVDSNGTLLPPAGSNAGTSYTVPFTSTENKEETIQKIKMGLSREFVQEKTDTIATSNKDWEIIATSEGTFSGISGMCDMYTTMAAEGFHFGDTPFCNAGDGAGWSQSLGIGSTCTGSSNGHGDGQIREGEDMDYRENSERGKSDRNIDAAAIFSSDCVLWDLPDDLINPIA